MKVLLRRFLYLENWLSKLVYSFIYRKWLERFREKKNFLFFDNLSCKIGEENLFNYTPKQKVTFNLPFGSNIDAVPELYQYYLDKNQFTLGQEQVAVFPKAYLLGNEAVGVEISGEIISDTALDEPVVLHKCNPNLIMNYEKYPVDQTFNWCCSLVNIFTSNMYSNYFHWITDSLILIQGIRYLEQKTGQKIKLIVPKKRTNYHNEYLKFLGYSTESLIEWDFTKVEIQNLVVVKSRRIGIHRDEIISPLGVKWLKTEVLKSVSLKNVFGENVFIVRKGNVARRIINIDEVEKIFSSKGYSFVNLDDLSVADQVSLFYYAKNVISPHGAGLVNMIFANQNIKIIELLGNVDNEKDYYWYAAYFSLANVLNHNYSYLICDIAPTYKRKTHIKQLYDIRVDVNKLVELVKYKIND